MAKNPQGADKKMKADDVMLMPSTKLVNDLAKMREDVKEENSSRSGEFGTEINKAVEKKHLDKIAHKIACALRALPDRKLAISLPHLMRYIDDMGLVERANKQAEIFDEQVEVDAGESGNSDADNKVTRIGAAARKVAQAAGAPVD